MDYTHLFKGCRSVLCEGGEYIPARFHAAALSSIAGDSPDITTRAHCTAGVRLEFLTDSSTLSFSFRCDHFARPIVAFDVWENGRYRKTFTYAENAAQGTFLYQKEDAGTSHILIYLPHLVRVALFDVCLGAALPAPSYAHTLLFYGDSLVQGMTAARPGFTWASLVTRALRADAFNFGVGGKKFDRTFLDQTAPVDGSAVFVGFGTNDAFQGDSPTCMRQNIASFFQTLREYYPTLPVYAITAPSLSDSLLTPTLAEALGEVRTITAEYAKRYGCVLIDGTGLLSNDPALFTDGVHPNEAGSSQYAARLLSQIEQDFR